MTDLTELRGLVATVVLTGTVREEFSACREEMRSFNVQHGYTNVEYRNFPAQLVEPGRDSALHHALNEGYDYVLQIDADATFPPHALAQILETAYVNSPDADIVGAYAQLKSPPNLPTIDTGTGTWEVHYPGEGTLPVMRTGGHFILVKTPILVKFGPPWFKTRQTNRPIDALADVDNYARIKLDGTNPLSQDEAWMSLLESAQEEGGGIVSDVGEDSGFCDAAKLVGANIVVDTNLVTGHIGTKVVTPEDLKKHMDIRERRLRLAVGFYE